MPNAYYQHSDAWQFMQMQMQMQPEMQMRMQIQLPKLLTLDGCWPTAHCPLASRFVVSIILIGAP